MTPLTAVPTSQGDLATVVVQRQTVGQTLNLNVTATRAQVPAAVNLLAGIVTRVGAPGTVKIGDCPYWVDAEPVCVIAGSTPMYRPLTLGSSGADVAQLRKALNHLGFLPNSAGSQFDEACRDAVIAWQRHVGAKATGTLALGSLIVVDQLPATIAFGPQLRRGAQLTGGESLVLQSSRRPSFALVLTQDQVSLVPTDSTITVHFGKQSWPARIAGSTVLENGSTSLALTAPGGGVLCGTHCDSLPAGASTYLSADVSPVAPTTGPAVPVSAVITTASGAQEVTVVDESGNRVQRTVDVLASQNGMAVVRGVAVGEKVVAVPSAASGGDPVAATGSAVASPSGTGTGR